jgi:hypothetical protein
MLSLEQLGISKQSSTFKLGSKTENVHWVQQMPLPGGAGEKHTSIVTSFEHDPPRTPVGVTVALLPAPTMVAGPERTVQLNVPPEETSVPVESVAHAHAVPVV